MLRIISGLVLYFVLGYFIVALIAPNMSLVDAMGTVFAPIYVDAPIWIFESLHSLFETMMSLKPEAAFLQFLIVMTMPFSIMISLASPVLWVGFVTILIWFMIDSEFPKITKALINMMAVLPEPGESNISDLMEGRLSIDESLKLDMKAKIFARAVKEELKKK